ncbi:lipopolysaccharide biosynthesis protein [Phocaeicola coprophilus]|jgi:O-antigen/teichoic acid export membrane protein|uniref:lipopolysaccharide biosynthesis protein n=1 Tax=Phocaeicola coprophilus TaxID=387090 RepID=UPI0026DC4CA0|nr:lipopolysaccharide biosynthesis protein [Phocaeicola coprophilus]
MTTQQENTKRIAKNTLMLYVRMLFGMLVSLYTSRVVLQALGVEDYGIYNVVGGFVAMFSLISGALSHSASRFLTFELGRGNQKLLQRYFSTSLLIHIALAFIILIVSETIGGWFLNTKMVMPNDRLYAANWVFHTSIISFMIGLLGVPYNALIISHERMDIFAYIGIANIILRLLVILFIAYVPLPFDRLVLYAVLLLLIALLFQLYYTFFCRKHFKECRLQLLFDKECWQKMWAFTGWNFIGGTAVVLKDQGVNVLLNLFIGPVINTARGLSATVAGAVTSFVGNFMTALNPQITKSYASGDYEYMWKLIERGTRFSFYIMLVLALPILFETNFILTLWLKNYPDHTVNFVRLVLLISMVDILSNTIITAQSATGKIKKYQIMVGGMLLTNFPLSYLFLKLKFQPECTLLIALFVSVCCLFLRLHILRTNIDLSIAWFLKRICANVFFVTLCSSIIPLVTYISMEEGWIRFILVSILSIFSSICSIWIIGCSVDERLFIYNSYLKIRLKFLNR